MSSDAAYILVARGHASLGSETAKPGEVLIITPYTQKVSKQKYDVGRFLSSWSNDQKTMNAALVVNLKRLQKRQDRAIFFGRYASTNFNISAPGSANRELARRSILGDKSIQKIRFSSNRDPVIIEKQVVQEFRTALISGDAQTLSVLMDPAPFGEGDLRGGANGARLLLAKQLLARRDWPRLLGDSRPTHIGDNLWQLSDGPTKISLTLHPSGDFTFIQSINTGA